MERIAHTSIHTDADSLTPTERAVSLFKFIKELSGVKQKTVLNSKEYNWTLFLSDLHDDPKNISLFYRDRVAEENPETSSVLLEVRKPEFKACPPPSARIHEWLQNGWGLYYRDAVVYDRLERTHATGYTITETKPDPEQPDRMIETYVELFTASEERVKVYNSWIAVRNAWVEEQKKIEKTRELFTTLYKLHIDLQRESETLEMVVSAGRMRDEKATMLDHPVLTRRLKTVFDADKNCISIHDADDVTTELSAMFLQQLDDINLASIDELQTELQTNDYHPLDRNDTPQYLKIFAHRISSEATFVSDRDFLTSSRGNSIFICHGAAFHVRKRVDGIQKAVERILEVIEKTNWIPPYISDIVSGGKIETVEDLREQTIDEKLASVGGESADILLTKEANREQLEIARRIEQYNAVLVQGPPGTGKTHTIANLMGHFLAQGKSILVTSHTKKALTVLKEKIPQALQPLCVSMLDDSNEDMQKSVQGITDYMGRNTSHQLHNAVVHLEAERNETIDALAETRRKIFALINKEYQSIVYLGDAMSPSEAAQFVFENEERLSYIPGEVELGAPLPLSLQEFSDLYKSNAHLTADDEGELQHSRLCPEDLMSPDDLEAAVEQIESGTDKIWAFSQVQNQKIRYESGANHIDIAINGAQERICVHQTAPLQEVLVHMRSFGDIEEWMRYAAVDGKKGGAFRQKWMTLTEQIEKTCQMAETVAGMQFGKSVSLPDTMPADHYIPQLEKLSKHFAERGKLNKFDLLLHHEFTIVLQAFSINGKQLQTPEDCDLIIRVLMLQQMREQCAAYWDDLLGGKGVPLFAVLDPKTPEQNASRLIPTVHRYLDWYKNDFDSFLKKLSEAGIPYTRLFAINPLDSELAATGKILDTIENSLPHIVELLFKVFDVYTKQRELNHCVSVLQKEENRWCPHIGLMRTAVQRKDVDAYRKAYHEYGLVHAKTSVKQLREELLDRLKVSAPQWAEEIQNREGMHGNAVMPENLKDAWKWKQLSAILREMYRDSYDVLQKKSLTLSKQYRKITTELAEKRAWYHLLSRTEADLDLRKALQGWRLTVQRIGRGTGKNAPYLRAEARKLMAKCQVAVPAWIMPIAKALEALDPANNVFDVIIVDEASQSDVTSLALTYMGKKLIVVGDDQQVSPPAIGESTDRVNALAGMYIREIVPNAHLYNGKTSLYDVASTTFKPLMLCEHFRCVPEIIGFSNDLSYDGRINPLREASSSNLLPAVVNYRVANGERVGKVNGREVDTILALIKSCMKQSEYDGKTFGIISMLSGEQLVCIQKELLKHFEPAEIEDRRILFGTSENFQGDERDVVFLSLVDSNPDHGPLNLMGFGADQGNRKRYNVAASRAKDQLWVVHSLDPANDLKPGDLRKRLIDYAADPTAFDRRDQKIKEQSDSPFEIAVAKVLASRGYNFVQQWKVGAYRIDIVVRCGNKAIALECDGDRFHSGEEKIREDMERQTILERLGWRFIRLRGSEYYRNPEKAIQRVCDELAEYGIHPEEQNLDQRVERRSSELLDRVKAEAFRILQAWETQEKEEEQKARTKASAPPQKRVEKKQESKKVATSQQLKLLITEYVPAETVAAVAETINQNQPLTPKQKPQGTKGTAEEKPVSVSKRSTDKAQSLGVEYRKKGTERASKKSVSSAAKRSGGDHLVETLKHHNLQFIDNRVNSGILWVLDDPVRHSEIETLIGKLGSFEKRGAIATGNKPAWRIMKK